jgi:hypothetical protein
VFLCSLSFSSFRVVFVWTLQLRQSPSLSKLPRVLILHLKRFQPNWRTGTYEKRQGVVKFDPTIDLSDFCAGDVAEPLPPPPRDEDDGGAATQNLQSRFDAASPARNDRKRKKADSDSDDSSRASSPSSARSAKAPRTASKAFIEFKEKHAKKLRAFKEQHTKTCGKTDHDYCKRFVRGTAAATGSQPACCMRIGSN